MTRLIKKTILRGILFLVPIVIFRGNYRQGFEAIQSDRRSLG